MVCSADRFAAMTNIDPRRIRMIARHFHDLQGLRLVEGALVLQAIAEIWLRTYNKKWTIAAALVAFLLVRRTRVPLDRYYATLGRVVTRQPGNGARAVFGMAIGLMVSMPPFSMPSLVWTLAAAVPLWIAFDCRPFRWHHVAVAIAMLYVAFGRLDAPGTVLHAWMAPRLWAFTSALAIGGLLDHKLLLDTMRQTRVLTAEAP